MIFDKCVVVWWGSGLAAGGPPGLCYGDAREGALVVGDRSVRPAADGTRQDPPRGGGEQTLLKGLILAQNERWRRGLGMQVERIPARGEAA